MKPKQPDEIARLEDLPNIGKSIANDLRAIGITRPEELKKRTALNVYNDLKEPMERRHDPCVLYTLLSVVHFFGTSERIPWWKFTAEGKSIFGRSVK
jgi:hypothetical protein